MTLTLVHSRSTYQPRGWQVRAKEAFLAYTGNKGCLIVAATGGGKTAFGHYIAVDYLERGERVLWLADQKVLVKQPLETLQEWWPHLVHRAGIVQAAKNQPNADIVYASKDTLKNPMRMAELLEAGPFALVVGDEAHKALSKTWMKVLSAASHDHTRFLFLTATPHPAKGNLSDTMDLVFAYPILDAIKDNVLVPPYAAVEKLKGLDLTEVKSTKGDYDAGELGAALLKAHIVEHTVAAMARSYIFEELPFRNRTVLAPLRGRQVLVHTATKEQAELTAAALNKDGWEARYVSGDTPDAEVDRLFNQFRQRKINVLLAAQKLSVGVDIKNVDAEVFASPTRSMVLYIQRLGRGLRVDGKKKDCLVLDLVGCTKDHSIVSAPVLVDGIDCPKAEDGKHKFLKIDGTNEGKCEACGKAIRCWARMDGHIFKDGRCKHCGAEQCADSPDKQHHWVPWEQGMRQCVHCFVEIPDPLAALIDRSPSIKEPVRWDDLGDGQAGLPAWGASLGRIGTLFTVQRGEDSYRVFLHTRDELVPLAPAEVNGEMARLLTDDVARRAVRVKGFYGGFEPNAERLGIVRMQDLARRVRVWEA